ncbi:hypothetical protein LY76DRAFT_26594 [Colletotrichum caudatum]|nr:hypothetical protein LY76DRAFT_26594 [Colletotrichum caudatum]
MFPTETFKKAFNHIIAGTKTDDGLGSASLSTAWTSSRTLPKFSHGDLVNLLHDRHRSSSGAIKLVVSGREHNVFVNGFSDSQRICLRELTRRDLERFAKDKLNGIKDSETRDQIVDKIVDEAGGIFYWVTLVVNSVRRRLEDGFDLDPDGVVEQIDYRRQWKRLPLPKPESSSVGPELIKVLLECGFVSWDTAVQWELSGFSVRDDEPTASMNLLQQSFLVASILATRHENDWIGLILEHLLCLNPDLDFSFSAKPIEHDIYMLDACMEMKLTSKGAVSCIGSCKRALVTDPIEGCGPKQIVETSTLRNKERILEMLEHQLSQAEPEAGDVGPLVGPEQSQTRASRHMAADVSRTSETDRSPGAEQLGKLGLLERVAPDGRIEKGPVAVAVNTSKIQHRICDWRHVW